MLYPDLMLDLEYLAGVPDAIIVQIGAVPFDLTMGNYDPEVVLSLNVSIDEQVRAGRKIDARTLEWWMGQAALKGVPPWFKDPLPVRKALETLSDFVEDTTDPRKVRVWGHMNCDQSKMGEIFAKNLMKLPWHPKNEHHISTLVYLSGVNPPKHQQSDHEAVNDCIRQVGYCHKCWKALRSRPESS